MDRIVLHYDLTVALAEQSEKPDGPKLLRNAVNRRMESKEWLLKPLASSGAA